jgi:hypothetical protein
MPSVSIRLILGISLLAPLSCSRSVGNADPKATIEAAWNGARVGLVTGQVRFIDAASAQRRPDASRGEDALSELPLYRAFAAKGFVAISAERDLTSGFTGWGDFMQLTQAGVRRTAHVTLTDKGKAAGEVTNLGGGVEELWLHLGHAEIKDIVANDTVTIGADHYRVVMGTHTFDIPEDLKAAYAEARGEHFGRERRFKALLKYDPFKKTWVYIGADLGPRDGNFSSDIINQVLAKLRLCGSLAC